MAHRASHMYLRCLAVAVVAIAAVRAAAPPDPYVRCINQEGPQQTVYQDFVAGRPVRRASGGGAPGARAGLRPGAADAALGRRPPIPPPHPPTPSTPRRLCIRGTPRRLLLRQAWWSEKRGRVPLTVVTGLTSSRLDQLAAQCASWRGPLSAAAYVVVRGDGAGGVSAEGEAKLAEAAAAVAAFHARRARRRGAGRRPRRGEGRGGPAGFRVSGLRTSGSRRPSRRRRRLARVTRTHARTRTRTRTRTPHAHASQPLPRSEVADGCQLDVSLLYEVVAEDVMGLLLPINTMRNYGLLQARRNGVSCVGFSCWCVGVRCV
jgi:hypothetical protein